MKDFTLSGSDWFDAAEEPVVVVRQQQIIYSNKAAADLGLGVDTTMPEVLLAPNCPAVYSAHWSGIHWNCRCQPVAQGALIQLRRAEDTWLSRDRIGQLAEKLRLPLGNLIGAIQLLETPREGRTPEKEERYRAIQRKNYHILLRMVDDLELLSSEDEAQPEMQVLDFAGLCTHVVRMTQALARQAGLSIDLELGEGNLLVLGNQSLLRKLLYHLISNAFAAAGKADDGGAITLRLEKAGNCLRLTVRDSGDGFAPEGLAGIFDPGYGEELIRGRGLGMGIPLCRQIVQKHGGRMVVAGGINSVVIVELPLAKSTPVVELHTGFDYDGGLSEVLTRLADVLPWQCFTDEE